MIAALLLSVVVQFRGDVIYIYGTPGDDQVAVNTVVTQAGSVYQLGRYGGPGYFQVNAQVLARDVGAVVVYCGPGDDQVNLSQINKHISPNCRKVSIHGHAGDDLLIGSFSVPTKIIPGTGNDTVYQDIGENE